MEQINSCSVVVDGEVCGQESCSTIHMIESGHDFKGVAVDEFLDALMTAEFCFFIDDFSFALEMRLNELNSQKE